jgi:cytochrome c-type biogenesis protein CcmF
VIFGTFLTRSGVLSSVHAFAASAIGPAFFVFIGLTFVVSLTLLFREWDHLKSDNQLDSLLSRETAFLLNNLLFIAIAASVFWGTVFPMISELVTGTKISVGPPFYNRVTGPQFAALVLLMGVCPLLAWRHASARRLGRMALVPLALALVFVIGLVVTGMRSWAALVGLGITVFVTLTTVTEIGLGLAARIRQTSARHESVWAAVTTLIDRNRRRYGGYTIHLAVVVMTVGIIGSNIFQQQTQGLLHQGEQMVIGQYMVTFKGLEDFMADNGEREVTRATLSVYRNGVYLGDLHPRRDLYVATGEPMTIAGVHSSVEDDLYIILADWEQTTASSATFKIYLNPLINWLWAGGVIFILGTLIAAWPRKED